MAKMRNFKFTDGKDFNEIVEALSFKKAVKSVQNKIDPSYEKNIVQIDGKNYMIINNEPYELPNQTKEQ